MSVLPAPGALAAHAELVIGRPGELWLKGNNRGLFERCLAKNLRHALREFDGVRVERLRNQINVDCRKVEGDRGGEIAARMTEVFGFSSVVPAWGVEAEPERIAQVASQVLEETLRHYPLEGGIRFRVRTKRGDKRFPMTSTELDRYVADRIPEALADRLIIDLKGAELTLGIHVRDERVYVFCERLPGAGGLPVGSIGRALCLLSGGIDSPVAAWLAMKRGCEVSFVSFHSYPYLGESSKRKIRRLAERLMRYQRRARLYSVPFAKVQETIRDEAPEAYRTVLYRRMMHRIATRIATRDEMGALVTGESLGQVASQTLENMTCIGAVASLPVLQPLIAYDKQETIAISRRIGTYDLSIQPEPDCCTVFQPAHPIVRGSLEACEEAEAVLDLEGLVEEAVSGAEVLVLGK